MPKSPQITMDTIFCWEHIRLTSTLVAITEDPRLGEDSTICKHFEVRLVSRNCKMDQMIL